MLKGFQNEFDFVLAINRKKVCQLHPLFYDLISCIFNNINDNDEVKAWKNHYKQKSDVFIKIGNEVRRISIKMGAKNSVHVEHIDTFKKFLKFNGVSDEIINSILSFQYADGTTNGTGVRRLSTEQYKSFYQNDIDNINLAINNNLKLINNAIDRFILKGLVFNDHIDALVYGVPNDFMFITPDEIKDIIISKTNLLSTGIHFGPLFYQPYNRCLNHNSKYEYGRDFIQIKWYSLLDHIIEYKNNKVIEDSHNLFQTDNVGV